MMYEQSGGSKQKAEQAASTDGKRNGPRETCSAYLFLGSLNLSILLHMERDGLFGRLVKTYEN